MDKLSNSKKNILRIKSTKEKGKISPSTSKNAKWKGRKSKSWLWV